MFRWVAAPLFYSRLQDVTVYCLPLHEEAALTAGQGFSVERWEEQP